MEFTKEQISELMCKHAEREHGLHDIFEIMLESMMAAERSEFLHDMRDGNKGTAIVWATPTGRDGSWSSGYRETVTATSIRRYLQC